MTPIVRPLATPANPSLASTIPQAAVLFALGGLLAAALAALPGPVAAGAPPAARELRAAVRAVLNPPPSGFAAGGAAHPLQTHLLGAVP